MTKSLSDCTSVLALLFVSALILFPRGGYAQNWEKEKRDELESAGFTFNAGPNRTQIGGLLWSTIRQVILFKRELTFPLEITGGSENHVHNRSIIGHHYGWKVDLGLDDEKKTDPYDDELSKYITDRENRGKHGFVFIGYRVDGNGGRAPQWRHPSGAIFALEYPPDFTPNGFPVAHRHWDVYFPIQRVRFNADGVPVEPLLGEITVKLGSTTYLQAIAEDALFS